MMTCILLLAIRAFRIFFIIHREKFSARSRNAIHVNPTGGESARNAFTRKCTGCSQRRQRNNDRRVHQKQTSLIPTRMSDFGFENTQGNEGGSKAEADAMRALTSHSKWT